MIRKLLNWLAGFGYAKGGYVKDMPTDSPLWLDEAHTIPESYIERLRVMTEDDRQKWLYGDWDIDHDTHGS